MWLVRVNSPALGGTLIRTTKSYYRWARIEKCCGSLVTTDLCTRAEAMSWEPTQPPGICPIVLNDTLQDSCFFSHITSHIGNGAAFSSLQNTICSNSIT